MREVSVSLYSFNELHSEAKERAITDFRTSSAMEWEVDLTTDDIEMICREEAHSLGYEDVKFEFSLGYSQSDYLDFNCQQYLTKEFIERVTGSELSVTGIIGEDFDIELVIKGKYGHGIEVDFKNYNLVSDLEVYELCEKLYNCIKSDYKELTGTLKRVAYDMYDDIDTVEHISEFMLDNEWEFFKDGKKASVGVYISESV